MKAVLAVLVLFAAFGLMGFTAVCHGASESDAQSAVANADQRVRSCYAAVAAAQKAGANVTGMLATLNDAELLLSKADLALQNGDFDSATNLAGQCVTELSGFEGVADGLRDSASQARFMDFAINEVGSSVGAVAVVVGGFLVWWFLKKKYAVRAGGV